MPLLILYQGRPVKRRRRIGQRLKTTFYATESGKRGQTLFVTQSQWIKHSVTLFVTRDEMPDVRGMS